jgi:hypothetical protein
VYRLSRGLNSAPICQCQKGAKSAAVLAADTRHSARVVLEPCPCDGCRLAERCKVERLACDAFAMVMAGKLPARWAVAPPVPTRARYKSVLGEVV